MGFMQEATEKSRYFKQSQGIQILFVLREGRKRAKVHLSAIEQIHLGNKTSPGQAAF